VICFDDEIGKSLGWDAERSLEEARKRGAVNVHEMVT
jgi:hypothetical protein